MNDTDEPMTPAGRIKQLKSVIDRLENEANQSARVIFQMGRQMGIAEEKARVAEEQVKRLEETLDAYRKAAQIRRQERGDK